MKAAILTLAVCAATHFPSLPAAAQEGKAYHLKLERPEKVGVKMHDKINATLENSQRVTQGGQTLKEEESHTAVELTGTSEVLGLSDKGRINKLKFTVGKFTMKEKNGSAEQPLKPGVVITGTSGGGDKKKFDADGTEIKGRTAEVLRELFDLSSDGDEGVDEDAVFGSKELRAPGSEWPVNIKALIDSMPDDMPFSLKPDEVTGTVMFPAVRTVGGVECCQVQCRVSMKPASIKGMPPGFKLTKVNFKIASDKLVPVDAALPILSEKMDQHMEFSGSASSPAGAAEVAVLKRTVKERVSTPVK